MFRRKAAAMVAVSVLVVLPDLLHSQEFPAEPAGAQPSSQVPVFREDLLVTANLIPVAPEEAGSVVTVLDLEEIARRGKSSVLDLLRTVPGLDATQGGGLGSVGSVFMRGANSNHTLVLIDGVRVNNTAGGFDFSSLRTDNIERIEILRGPQSTLYGSEAIGGVISIMTRQGRPGFRLGVDGRAGNHDSHEVRVDADGGRGRFDYSIALADQRAGGLSVAGERSGNTEEDAFSNRSGSARVGFSFLDNGRAVIALRHLDSESDLDGFALGIGPTDDPNFGQRRQVSVGSLQIVKTILPRWNFHVSLGVSEDQVQGKDPDTVFNNFDIRSRLHELKTQSDFELGPGNTLVVGLSSERRRGENRGSYAEDLTIDSVYLQENWSWRDRLFVTAGLRHDRYSDLDGEITWRGTFSYLTGPGSPWKLHGSYGTGFRGPSFDELYFPLAGNLDLQPETSRGYDLGAERRWAGGAAIVDVTGFSNEFENLINFDFTTSTFGNVQRASSHGIEASVKLQPRQKLELRASYTYNDTEDRATGKPLPRRARHRESLDMSFAANERLRSTASLMAVQDRIDSDGTKMDEFVRVDLKIDYSAQGWLQPYLLFENLLNWRYEEVTGYTSPGLTAFVGLRLHAR